MKHKSKAKREARKRNTFEAQQAHATRVLKKLQAKIPDISKPAPERAWDIKAVVIMVERRLCKLCMTNYDVPQHSPMLRLERPNTKHPGGAPESRIGKIAKSEIRSLLDAGYAIEHRQINGTVPCCAKCTPERPAQVNSSPGIPRQLLGDTLLSGEEVDAPKPKASVPALEDF